MPLAIWTLRAFLLSPALFFDEFLNRFVFQAEIGIHLFQATILFLECFQALDVRCFHATVLRLPIVVCRAADPVIATDLFNLQSCFNFLQDRNDLGFGKS